MKNFWLGFLVCALLTHFDSKAFYDGIEYGLKRMDRIEHMNDRKDRKEVEARVVGFKG